MPSLTISYLPLKELESLSADRVKRAIYLIRGDIVFQISQSQRKALDMLALLFKLSDNHPVFQYYKLVHNPSNSPMKREDHSMKEEVIYCGSFHDGHGGKGGERGLAECVCCVR